MVEYGEYWDFLMPSKFSRPTELLAGFKREIGLERGDDPVVTISWLNARVYEAFDYVQLVTRADSPIDDALSIRQGVCQDFTHIMIALLRDLGVPARYVSGYLYHRSDTRDRSVADATHAWVETLLPGLGWVGFDPTNNLVVGERHIRTAVGRDYADVMPTRGTFKGQAMQEMKVAVHVTPADAPRPEEVEPVTSAPWIVMTEPSLSAVEDTELLTHQQQQQ
jgi:transglutaminase-like putative cysteine protease